MADPTHLAPPDADVEQGTSESAPLLRPSLSFADRRPSYRKRRISLSNVTPETSQTRWRGIAGAVIAFFLLLVGGTLVALRERRAGQKEGGETPDFTKLPAPQPGLRNPNYLVSGDEGGVATEVGICSDIGVEGAWGLSDGPVQDGADPK